MSRATSPTELRQPVPIGGPSPAEIEGAGVRETIDDPARVSAVLRSLAYRHARGRTHSGARVQAAQWDRSARWPLYMKVEGAGLEAGTTIELEGYNSIFRFVVLGAVRTADAWRLELPAEVQRIRRRTTRRASTDDRLTLHFRHPAGHCVDRPVHDIGWGGVAFVIDPLADVARPGLELEVELRLDGSPGWRATARVAHVSRLDDGVDICGVELRGIEPAGALTWIELVERYLHPHTERGVRVVDALWDLYGESGYFNLSGKQAGDFEALKESFAAVARRLADAPAIGCHVVWPSTRGYECSMAHFKLYSRSWFSAQLAKKPGEAPSWLPGRPILGDVYLHTFEHALRQDGVEWMVAYVHGDVRFSRLVHHDFLLPYVPSGGALLHPFRAVQIPAAVRAAADPSLVIAPADAVESALLLDCIAAVHPKPYLDALDFSKGELRLASVGAEWRAHGLSREREVWVARRGGTPLAACVMESGETGVHMFGLIDTVRVFSLHADGRDAYESLLGAAGTWYRSRGKEHYVYLDEELAARPIAMPQGSCDLGTAYLALLAARHVPDLVEFVWELTAPRPPLWPIPNPRGEHHD